MTDVPLHSIFPSLYRALLPPLFEEALPAEEKADCANCVMCPPKSLELQDDEIQGRGFFLPQTKCCTYHPSIPNYLVGGLLLDERAALAEGQARMRARLRGRIGVSPRWVAPSRKYSMLFHASRWQSFGRSALLVCPFFEQSSGNCTVWAYREAACSTFFCKYNAGADGQHLWRGLGGYLNYLEEVLTVEITRRVAPTLAQGMGGPKIEHPERLTLRELEERPVDEQTYAAQWGDWVNKEAEFYEACYHEVCKLTRDEVTELLGEEGTGRLSDLRRRYTNVTTPTLPAALIPNPKMHQQLLSDEHILLKTYSHFDTLAFPRVLEELLDLFATHKEVAKVREELAQEQSEVDDDFLLMLVQHRILVEPQTPGQGPSSARVDEAVSEGMGVGPVVAEKQEG